MKLTSICAWFLFVLPLFPKVSLAQDSVVAKINAPEISYFTLDPDENIYLVSKGNNLLRYSSTGKPSGYYNNIQNGNLSWIDASNPLKVLLFYPQFSKIVVLDKMMSQKAVLSLQQLGLFSVSACGVAEDGNIWVYDNLKSKLFKINMQLEVVAESNDLRSETGTVPTPSSLVASDGKVYLCDTVNGVYVFDRYASYLNTLSLKDVKQLQVYGQQLVWLSGNQLESYNLQSFQSKEINLPKGVLNAAISRNRLIAQFPDKILIFYWPNL